ncbi:RtcB family protein [Ruminococcus sp. CLA-AA-H200]|uniref:3'-phosphate/5'-hydroxy nucleic acid ligase n=1 Tax=Ruminococcus turbiniformis TaxID=2881258 RepID=A0ABS8FU59_9FIRM|nr:RtcB family protein [Ruminococcus turbiniformis]MCC2253581.1 RtcB family protein [Ruminococcus turbiniformis]
MFEVKGKYATAIVYTELADQSSISQVLELCNQEFVKGQKIRLMPDIHAGAGCTIGTTMTIGDKVVPNLVGVDIGCGMAVAILEESAIDLKQLDETIHQYVPAGFSIREKTHPFVHDSELHNLRCMNHINLDRAEKSIGTLGGGNHFIEIDRDVEGHLYLVVHSGSRHLGVEIASFYQQLAYERLNNCSKAEVDALIKRLKTEGKRRQIEAEIKKLKNTKQTNIPKQLAYVEGSMFDDYIHDMRIAQQYAVLNRQAIVDTIEKQMGLHVVDEFTTIHNYIDLQHLILRKGAVSAQKGERLIIPINMRDGSLICIGKGNQEWNCSAPHGAGRLMSRSEAKSSFTVSAFEEEMEGIYTTSVGRDTLDECPMAYKPIESIINNIGGTVEVKKIIRPIYNFKAGGA